MVVVLPDPSVPDWAEFERSLTGLQVYTLKTFGDEKRISFSIYGAGGYPGFVLYLER